VGEKPRLTAVGSGDALPPQKRAASTIAFPYTDLAEAEKAVAHVAGSGGQCRPEQLSAWLGHRTLNSGAFRNKVAAAKLFGVLEGRRNLILLADLGRRLADPESVRQARVEAFLAVPLYRTLVESWQGKRMPGVMGLELEMLRLGVARTQVQAARQAFLRSAEQAGFLESGPGQLVLPKGTVFPPKAGVRTEPAGGGTAYPKVIEAILDQAPWNSQWSAQEFDEWAALLVQASRLHFKLPAQKG
jgi:hypothetical protein